jgi:chromosome segregation ATPase
MMNIDQQEQEKELARLQADLERWGRYSPLSDEEYQQMGAECDRVVAELERWGKHSPPTDEYWASFLSDDSALLPL